MRDTKDGQTFVYDRFLNIVPKIDSRQQEDKKGNK
jgi:hypothetical protein